MLRRSYSLALPLLLLVTGGPATALTFDFTFIDDANGSFASRGWLDPDSLFQRNIRAAADLWGAKFNSDATLVIDVDAMSFSARAGGTNTLGRFLYTSTDGKNVWEFGPLTRILTGDNPGEDFYGYDILLGFDAQFAEDNYWFDPQPELRTAAVPADKGDFMSVVLHELGHGFGMTGFRDFQTGQILGNDATQFDELSYFGGDGEPFDVDGDPNPMFFSGTQAAALFGSDVPLTHKPIGDPNYSQNFFHLSACDAASPDGLEGTLMNGCVLPNGERLQITPFDLAVYADLGYPIATLAGDYNHNGTVDAADYTVWRDTLGRKGAGLSADGDGDNEVGTGDHAIWKAQFGKTVAGRVNPAVNVAVPEPESWLLLSLAVGSLLARRP